MKLDSGGTLMVATRHEPTGPHDPRSAVVLLNAGAAPRSGNADLYTRIAVALAEAGIVTYLIDLPGLGDSAGESFPTLDAYWGDVQRGCHDQAVGAALTQLRDRFGASRIILGGLCAGAINAVRYCASSASPPDALVLLEPNFRRFVSEASRRTPGTRRPRYLDVNRWLRYLSSDRRLVSPLRPLRPALRAWLTRRAGHIFPDDVNADHVRLWRACLESRIPTLVACCAAGPSSSICRQVLGDHPRSDVTRATLAATNHILTEGDGGAQALAVVVRWCTQLLAPEQPGSGCSTT